MSILDDFTYLNRFVPKYPDDTDYNTNSPSYYEYLAKQNKVMKILIQKIYDYDKELAKRFEEWDKNLEDFPDDVKDLLVKWLNDGTLAQIINDEVLGNKADKDYVDDLNKNLTVQLADTKQLILSKGIYPDDLDADTDFEKVQMAIDKAIAEHRSVIFERMYDITGHTLIIDKPKQSRRILYLQGSGGGLIKNDEGFFFTGGGERYASDVSSQEIVYQSQSGSGACVFDGDASKGIIRLSSEKDTYLTVDHVIQSTENHIQSVRIIGCTITGGKGWAIEFKVSFDTTIINNTIEHREHGIRNTGYTANPDNNTLRIENNVIEGLSGKGIELGSSFGVIIKGNYMELNQGGYFDFSLSENYHNGLTLIGNTVQQSKDQITNKEPAFKMGKLGDGVNAEANISTGVLFETTKAGTAGRIISIGSFSYSRELEIPAENKIVREFGRNRSTDNSTVSGSIEMYRKSINDVFFNPGEEKLLQISYDGIATIDLRTMVSVDSVTGSGDGKVELLSYIRAVSTNSIFLLLKNNSTSTQNLSVYTSLLQIRY